MVTICPPDSADRIKKYFRTKQEADAFYQEQIKFIDSIPLPLKNYRILIIFMRNKYKYSLFLGTPIFPISVTTKTITSIFCNEYIITISETTKG